MVRANWTEWTSYHDSPYVDWDAKLEGLTAITRGARENLAVFDIPGGEHFESAATVADDTPLDEADRDALQTAMEQIADAPPDGRLDMLDRIYTELIKQVLARLRASIGGMPPFPKDAAYSEDPNALLEYFHSILETGTIPEALKQSTLDDAFHLDENGAIIGVIDLGVSLGQQRTRQVDQTKTRFLAAWQQTAPRRAVEHVQGYLPFGEELLATEINDLIDNFTLDQRFDEEGFNRATCVEDYRRTLGHRELGLAAPHGTHILDCAAGYDATVEGNQLDATSRRIIAVNLPSRELVGHAAQHLEFFATFGLLRIAILSDAIWFANKKHFVAEKTEIPSCEDRKEGYYTVVNLSFGKQASSRDGTDLLAEVLRYLNAAREAAKLKPIYLSMPAGNENLERGNARTRLQAGAEVTIDWRVLPEDQSANFLEIWAEYSKPDDALASTPLDIEITAPTGERLDLTSATGKFERTFQCADKEPLARLYALPMYKSEQDKPDSSDTSCENEQARMAQERGRQAYVLATRWTQMYSDPVPPTLGLAGLWRIRLRNSSSAPMLVVASTQTDQTEKPNSVTNQRSYFDHQDYERFDKTGRERDSYSYPMDQISAPVPLDSSNLIRRHGTLNAIGKERWTLLTAGYLFSDGRMEAYSSTGVKLASRGRGEGTTVPGVPTASMPCRDGTGHFGRIAAGGRDGSAAALQGTSVAAAMMTRRFVDHLMNTVSFVPEKKILELQIEAGKEEKAARYPGRVVDVKAGSGRMNASKLPEKLGRFHRGVRERRR
ncbi:MAG: hypothetical protein AAGF27_01270 [Pseudomonadota bacterium]